MFKLKIYIFPLLLIISNITNAQKILDRVVATVNNNIILESDLEFYKLEKKDTNMNSCEVLKKTIIDKMLLAKSEKDSITIKEEEVNNELDRRIFYFSSIFGSNEKMENYYNKSIVELKTLFRSDVENKMKIERVKSKLFSDVKPSPNEVKEYFNLIDKDSVPFYNSEVQLSQILITPKISRENRKFAKDKISKIYQQVKNKESDITTLAVLNSDDTYSATNGGSLGWISRGEMVPEFEHQAYTTNIGSFSEIFETKYGFHFLKVEDKKNEKIKVSHILVTIKSDDIDFSETKKQADSIYNLLQNNTVTFQKAVQLYSNDDVFKANGGIIYDFKNRTSIIEINNLEPSLVEIVNKMKEGEITLPLAYQSPSGKVGYRIVKLISETKPHKANLSTDYSKIKELAQENHINKTILKWFEAYKNEMYIKIISDYNKCSIQ